MTDKLGLEPATVAARLLERIAAAERRWPDMQFNSARMVMLSPDEARVIAAVLRRVTGNVVAFPAPPRQAAPERVQAAQPSPLPKSPPRQKVAPSRPGVRLRR